MTKTRPARAVGQRKPEVFMGVARSIRPQFGSARRSTFSTIALAAAAAAAALVLGAGASSAIAQAPQRSVDPGITNGTAQQQLNAAKQRWQAAQISNYHYTVERQCFCAPSFRGPVTIVVRNDKPENTPAGFENVATVPLLHAIVQKAINDKVDHLAVVYDRRGVPLSIAIDGRVMIADDEITYLVSGFTVDYPRPSLLVSYHRTGGFIGVDDRLSITSGGHVTRTDRTGATVEFDLSPAALSELQGLLAAADFPSLAKVYKPPFTVSDGFDFTITSQGRTVMVFAEATIPPALDAVIHRLTEIFGEGAPI
jgi:hypothetical protein